VNDSLEKTEGLNDGTGNFQDLAGQSGLMDSLNPSEAGKKWNCGNKRVFQAERAD